MNKLPWLLVLIPLTGLLQDKYGEPYFVPRSRKSMDNSQIVAVSLESKGSS